jgi:hypothetical protein
MPWKQQIRSGMLPVCRGGASDTPAFSRQGSSVQVHQEPYPVSAYHDSLLDEDTIQDSKPAVLAGDIRSWSDYSRVFYERRSLQRIPDIMDSDAAEGNWEAGKQLFSQFDAVSLIFFLDSPPN